MKTLDIQTMESISAGSFWGSFCATGSIISGAAGLAAYAGLIAISGGTAIVGLGILAVGCGLAYYA